ncbi:hypothetical protein [Streptosporangium sandarakinum]|uniref:hypothetical protein n=1 Tax=Streptosporangium sandarakinum TaxID=1260955 RepID=UPI003431895D
MSVVSGGGGRPRRRPGLSLTRAALGCPGLEWQRTPSSGTLRGAGAAHVVGMLARHLRGAHLRARARS